MRDLSVLEHLIIGRVDPHIYAFMTNTIPNARIPLIDACFRIFARFLGVIKLGFSIVSTIISAMKMTKIKYSLIRAVMPFFDFIFPLRPVRTLSCTGRVGGFAPVMKTQTEISDASLMTLS